MQQYIYGNINKAGYTFVSSDPAFFKDAKRQSNLDLLIKYDMSCAHGELAPDAHQSYWMTFTDLNITGEAERLYFQASGCDPFRSTFYVQGYMSDPEETDLCGPGLLRMLRTTFSSYQESVAAAMTGGLKPISREMLPIQTDMQPAPLHRELLGNILLALLDGDRVIVRLPAAGAAAMKLSREFLLAVYQRLPYEQRRLNGFFTGASSKKINDLEKPLPGSIKLILMDADADATGLEGSWSSKFIDLTVPGMDTQALRREKNGKQLYYVPLIDFLLDSSLEELDDFFRFCQNYLKAEGGSDPDIKKYLLLLEIFRIGQTEATDEQIVIWADSIFNKSWSAESKEQVYARIAGTLTPERLLQHLKRMNNTFGCLETLGVLSAGRSRSKEEVRDENSAYTLRMTEALLQRYPAGTGTWLQEELYKHFTALAVKEHSCLQENHPNAAVIRDYDRLSLFPNFENTTPLVKNLRDQVYQVLRDRDAAIRKFYREEYARQYHAGIESIRQTQLASASGLQTPLGLYQSLQQHYLYSELLNGQDHPTWNELIGQKIADICENVSPQDINSCNGLLAWLSESNSVFEENHGQFSSIQEDIILSAKKKWEAIITLYNTDCTTLPEMLQSFEDADTVASSESLCQALKEKLKDSLLTKQLNPEQVFSCQSQLLQHCKNTSEHPLFREVIGSIPDMLTIPDTMEPMQILNRLNRIQALVQSKLVNDTVNFPAWKQSLPVNQLYRDIQTLQSFSSGTVSDKLENPFVRKWAAKMLQDNTDLMLFLALHYDEYRSPMIPLLAARSSVASQHNIQALYIAGCTKEELCRGAGEKTTLPWKQEVERLFNEWVSLPEFTPIPAHQYDTAENHLVWIMVILTCLAGLVSPVLLLCFADRILLHWISAMLMPLVLALGCFASGFAVAADKQRRLLRWLSVSLLPGMAASLVMLLVVVL